MAQDSEVLESRYGQQPFVEFVKSGGRLLRYIAGRVGFVGRTRTELPEAYRCLHDNLMDLFINEYEGPRKKGVILEKAWEDFGLWPERSANGQWTGNTVISPKTVALIDRHLS